MIHAKGDAACEPRPRVEVWPTTRVEAIGAVLAPLPYIALKAADELLKASPARSGQTGEWSSAVLDPLAVGGDRAERPIAPAVAAERDGTADRSTP